MFLYFRHVRVEDIIGFDKWIEKVKEKDSSINDEISGNINSSSFNSGEQKLFFIEKGDDTYGVFSYTIGRFVVTGYEDTVAKISIIPSSDPEWDDEAQMEFFRLISKGKLDEMGYKSFRIDVSKNAVYKNKLAELGYKKISESENTIEIQFDRKLKVFVTGVNSELGYEVLNTLVNRGIDVIGCDTDDALMLGEKNYNDTPYIPLDIADEDKVANALWKHKPTALINCYSWSKVDDAEMAEHQEAVYKANVEGVKNLAKACKAINAKMMQVSSDYVFNGSGNMPWDADCKAYAPLNYYGKTRAEAENIVSSVLSRYFIVRTEWGFGERSHNFVDLVLDFAKKRSEITVVSDQMGIPTYYHDLSRLVADMIDSEQYGYYNVTNSGEYVSRNEYAREIFNTAVLLGHTEYGEDQIKVEAVTSEEYRLSRAIRPLNSRLDISKIEQAGFTPLPHWKDALKRYLEKKGF